VLPSAALDQYRAQQRLIVAILGLTRREWAAMGPDFDTSWAKIGPRITLLTASAQLGAARNGAAYVPATLTELGQSINPLAEVDPQAFAGIAADGRPLVSLLYGAVTTAKSAAQTLEPQAALQTGGKWLDMAIHTQVADASRGAAGVAIAARPGIGYIRMVYGVSCSRCAVLAGRWYRYNQGFQRHPRCDCQNVPCGEGSAKGLTAAPPLDQITGLNAAERKALTDGADLGQVVNAKRGAQGMTTSEGTTTSGLARQRLGPGRQRLTPDGIYRIASDRTEALNLLQQHGYLL